MDGGWDGAEGGNHQASSEESTELGCIDAVTVAMREATKQTKHTGTADGRAGRDDDDQAAGILNWILVVFAVSGSFLFNPKL